MGEGEAIIAGLEAYWRGVFSKRPDLTQAGLDLIGKVLDWRAECLDMAQTGQDGAE